MESITRKHNWIIIKGKHCPQNKRKSALQWKNRKIYLCTDNRKMIPKWLIFKFGFSSYVRSWSLKRSNRCIVMYCYNRLVCLYLALKAVVLQSQRNDRNQNSSLKCARPYWIFPKSLTNQDTNAEPQGGMVSLIWQINQAPTLLSFFL